MHNECNNKVIIPFRKKIHIFFIPHTSCIIHFRPALVVISYTEYYTTTLHTSQMQVTIKQMKIYKRRANFLCSKFRMKAFLIVQYIFYVLYVPKHIINKYAIIQQSMKFPINCKQLKCKIYLITKIYTLLYSRYYMYGICAVYLQHVSYSVYIFIFHYNRRSQTDKTAAFKK